MEQEEFESGNVLNEIIIPDELIIDESVIKVKKKKVSQNYINNSDFYDAIVDYKLKCESARQDELPKPQISRYIGECFNKLAEGLSRRPNFFGYSYRDDMVFDGIENCLRYVENFNPEKTKNPFAYFTQILWWAFVRRINKEKTQQYIKYKATEIYGVMDTAEYMESGDGNIKQLEVYDNQYQYIRKYEETVLKKLEKNIKEKQTKISGIEKFLEDA
jgi:hypothetical protein